MSPGWFFSSSWNVSWLCFSRGGLILELFWWPLLDAADVDAADVDAAGVDSADADAADIDSADIDDTDADIDADFDADVNDTDADIDSDAEIDIPGPILCYQVYHSKFGFIVKQVFVKGDCQRRL